MLDNASLPAYPTFTIELGVSVLYKEPIRVLLYEELIVPDLDEPAASNSALVVFFF